MDISGFVFVACFVSVILGGILVVFFPAEPESEEVELQNAITYAHQSLGIDNVYHYLQIAMAKVAKCQPVNQKEVFIALKTALSDAKRIREDKTSSTTDKLIAQELLRQAILKIQVQYSPVKNQSVENIGFLLLFSGGIGLLIITVISMASQFLK